MGRAPRHPALKHALQVRAEVREEYGRLIEAQCNEAEDACRGVLLNEKGRAAGVDPLSLFMGRQTVALYYASEELKDWWNEHPRVTFTQYEAQRSPVVGHHWGDYLYETELY